MTDGGLVLLGQVETLLRGLVSLVLGLLLSMVVGVARYVATAVIASLVAWLFLKTSLWSKIGWRLLLRYSSCLYFGPTLFRRMHGVLDGLKAFLG